MEQYIQEKEELNYTLIKALLAMIFASYPITFLIKMSPIFIEALTFEYREKD